MLIRVKTLKGNFKLGKVDKLRKANVSSLQNLSIQDTQSL